MIHECNYCTYQLGYKSNLKSHMKSKHNDKISLQKDEGKPMKNHKQIKKLEMMMKKNFQTGVEIETMKRKVKSLGDGNTNEFKQLAREYVELTGETLPKDFFFNFTCRNPPPPLPQIRMYIYSKLQKLPQIRMEIYSKMLMLFIYSTI